MSRSGTPPGRTCCRGAARGRRGAGRGSTRPRRDEVHHVVREADRGAGVDIPQHGGRGRVRRVEVSEGQPGRAAVRETRRDLPVEEPAEKEDERLVQRDPDPHARRERLGDAPGEACEGLDGRGRRPRRLRVEPGRVRVVMQRDDRLEASGEEPVHKTAVTCERGIVVRASRGLDPAPRHRKPECIRAGVRGKVGVLLVALPRAGRAAAGAALRPARRLPRRPVAGIPALDLVMRDGHAPEARPVLWREHTHLQTEITESCDKVP